MSGGLIALTVEEAQRLLKWPMVEYPDETWWTDDDEVLWHRIREWRDRHSTEVHVRGD